LGIRISMWQGIILAPVRRLMMENLLFKSTGRRKWERPDMWRRLMKNCMKVLIAVSCLMASRRRYKKEI
jgi:hypothetical protein